MLWLEPCHLFSGVHWRALAQLTSLIFCIILSILTREQPMAHRITKTFFFTLFMGSHLFPICLKLFYPTLSSNGLIVLVSFMSLNLSYFTINNNIIKRQNKNHPASSHPIGAIMLIFLCSHPILGEGNGNPLQCSCLENPRDGGARWASVYGVAQSWTQLK